MAGNGLPSCQGNAPSPSAFTYLLRNPLFCGCVALKKDWYPGRRKGIVTFAEYSKAQAMLDRLKERRAYHRQNVELFRRIFGSAVIIILTTPMGGAKPFSLTTSLNPLEGFF